MHMPVYAYVCIQEYSASKLISCCRIHTCTQRALEAGLNLLDSDSCHHASDATPTEWEGHLGSPEHSQTLGWDGPRVLRKEWASRLHQVECEAPKTRDVLVDFSVLTGACWHHLPREPHRTVRFMVSSTFTVRTPIRKHMDHNVHRYL